VAVSRTRAWACVDQKDGYGRLRRWCAVLEERDEGVVGNDGGGDRIARFSETGSFVKGCAEGTGRGCVMAGNADGAVVVVHEVLVVMERRHDRGDQEKEYENGGEALVQVHMHLSDIAAN
jgi:hypothetical protein